MAQARQQRGGWQIGTDYVLADVRGATSPLVAAAAEAAGAMIAARLNQSVRLLKANRELQGSLAREGDPAGGVAFTWTAAQANEPSVLFYWAKLKYALTLTDARSGAQHALTLVFSKRINKTGVGIVAVGVAAQAGGALGGSGRRR